VSGEQLWFRSEIFISCEAPFLTARLLLESFLGHTLVADYIADNERLAKVFAMPSSPSERPLEAWKAGQKKVRQIAENIGHGGYEYVGGIFGLTEPLVSASFLIGIDSSSDGQSAAKRCRTALTFPVKVGPNPGLVDAVLSWHRWIASFGVVSVGHTYVDHECIVGHPLTTPPEVRIGSIGPGAVPAYSWLLHLTQPVIDKLGGMGEIKEEAPVVLVEELEGNGALAMVVQDPGTVSEVDLGRWRDFLLPVLPHIGVRNECSAERPMWLDRRDWIPSDSSEGQAILLRRYELFESQRNKS
jgi:hypothetical protein